MVGYAEDSKVYKLFDPSSQKIFIERSVQFEEEPMQEIELVKGDCSHPPLNDDVSDYSPSDFSDSNEYYDVHTNHDSPIRPKWAEKTIQATSHLAGDLLDSRKTRSQFHNALSNCDSNISERCFMMAIFDPHSYE